MPTKQVNFTVQNNGLSAYSIAVYENIANRKDLTIVNGKGYIILETSVEHSLVWWLVGNSGSSITIEAQVNGSVVLNPAVKSKIPNGESRAYGYRYFKIS